MLLIRKNGKAYLMEAAGLGGFVFLAGLLAIFLEHPDLPVMHSSLKDYPFLRRIPLAVIMGAYVFGLTLLFGNHSGAQINPSVTWSMFMLNKIKFWDAVYYTIAQFAGAVAAVQLLKHFTGGLFSHPFIDFGVTKPKPPYTTLTAFTAEMVISFILMLVLLYTSGSKRFQKYTALLCGLLLTFYIIFEMPFSGMSLNPARSFAGALAAHEWKYLWVYFVAPPLAMIIAAKIYKQWERKKIVKADKDFKEIAIYPVAAKK